MQDVPQGIKRALFQSNTRDRAFIVDTATDPFLKPMGGGVFRKRSRICAVQIAEPFRVETEHGWMDADAGDYLVTNHPDDDPTSDIWPVSKARFEATYEPAEEA